MNRFLSVGYLVCVVFLWVKMANSREILHRVYDKRQSQDKICVLTKMKQTCFKDGAH